MSANNHPKNEVITQQNIQGAYEAIQKKIVTEIWKDESLRAKMLKDPKGTIENLIGHKFDANLNVKVLDTAENCVTFLLPNSKEKALGNREFSDLQLDAVAGGFSLSGLGGGLSSLYNAAGGASGIIKGIGIAGTIGTGLGASIAGAVGGERGNQAAGILGGMSGLFGALSGANQQQK